MWLHQSVSSKCGVSAFLFRERERERREGERERRERERERERERRAGDGNMTARGSVDRVSGVGLKRLTRGHLTAWWQSLVFVLT